MRAFAELNDKGDRIHVHFRYDKATVAAVKAVPGARFVSANNGGPFWALPLSLTSARRLRENLGDNVQWGKAVLDWGREQRDKERNLRAISRLDDVPVEELLISEKLPELANWLRPYQRADIKFLATANALNLLEPRLGKTTETIGAIYECGIENGPHLVATPSTTSIEDVWQYEWERWTDMPVFKWSGEESAKQRREALAAINGTERFVFVTTPNMVRRGLPEPLDGITWKSFTIDEFHKTGLSEPKNKFPIAANKVKVEGRKFALSGTPMGGRPIKLWGGLHFLEPQAYTSKWRWADEWLEVTSQKIMVKGILREIKDIGGIQHGREEQFYNALAAHAIRRTREEMLPELPPKLPVDVWCRMTKKQSEQYRRFAADTEIRIDEHYLTATSILAEYTRLKQFAQSYCEVDDVTIKENGEQLLKLRATTESGKLPSLMDRLAEVGIDPDEPAGDAQAIVTSEFKETADMLYDYLTERGIKCAKITGDVRKKGERAAIVRAFKKAGDHQGLRVVCMTTTAGGVAITLDNVESVHILGETWNPDDQTQVSDRAVNTSSLHQVTVFTYRMRDTIEEDIYRATREKEFTNATVLDLVRQGWRAGTKEGT